MSSAMAVFPKTQAMYSHLKYIILLIKKGGKCYVYSQRYD